MEYSNAAKHRDEQRMLEDRRRTSRDDLQGGCSQPKPTQLALQSRKPKKNPNALLVPFNNDAIRAVEAGVAEPAEIDRGDQDGPKLQDGASRVNRSRRA